MAVNGLAFAFECKYSESMFTALKLHKDVEQKYNYMVESYTDHLEGGQYAGKSAMGNLKLKRKDIFLVVCQWEKEEEEEEKEERGKRPTNDNIIILDRDRLSSLYSPSLYTRDVFLWREAEDKYLKDCVEQGKDISKKAVRVSQLADFCERHKIEAHGNATWAGYWTAIKQFFSTSSEMIKDRKREAVEEQKRSSKKRRQQGKREENGEEEEEKEESGKKWKEEKGKRRRRKKKGGKRKDVKE